MAAVELDPQFIKALRLLRSKSKDSGTQLRAMLDEAIRQKKGLCSSGPRSPSLGKQQSRSMSSERSLDKDKLEKEKKKDLDRLKKDLSELTDRPLEIKRSRLDSPALSSSSHTPSPTPPPSRGEADLEMEEEEGSEAGDSYGDLEMNLEDQFDCSCCVCKTFTQESGNKLMECSSCQNLYHQECHNPPVSNEMASDPRLIWNCSNCSNKGKGGSSKSSSSSGSVREERRHYDKEVTKPSPSSGTSSAQARPGGVAPGSSKHKPSPAKSESRSTLGAPVLSLPSLTSNSTVAKVKTGPSGGAGAGPASQGPAELSTTAKKRMKLIKQQAADMSSISKKKSSK